MAPKIKLNADLWEKVQRVSKAAGYSSPEEFVEHVIEREIVKLEGEESDDDIAKKLKGLGYLD